MALDAMDLQRRQAKERKTLQESRVEKFKRACARHNALHDKILSGEPDDEGHQELMEDRALWLRECERLDQESFDALEGRLIQDRKYGYVG